MDFAKYRKLFLDEARVHLAGLEAAIMQMESATSSDAVASAFRHAHSLKGMAASMGYDAMAILAHRLEDVLASMRDAPALAGRDAIDTLLAAHDSLTRFVNLIERDEPLQSDDELIARLGNWGGRPRLDSQASTASKVEAVPESEASGWLAINFAPSAPLLAARAFQVAKILEGYALAFDPPVQEIRRGNFKSPLRVRLAAALPPELESRLRAIPDLESIGEPVRAMSEGAVTAATTPVAEARPRIEIPSQIRIDTAVLERFVDLVGELVTVNNQIRETSRGLFSEELSQNVDALGRITGDLYHEVLQARLLPFGLIAERLPRTVREVAKRVGKEVELTIEGSDVGLDRSVMEHLSDPLLHLVRNAVDHGIESPAERQAAGKPRAGRLSIRVRHAESSVLIDIQDDGGGIAIEKVVQRALERGLIRENQALSDEAVYAFLFLPGFSTAKEVSDISGRGVGLDVVKNAIETVGGEVQIESRLGAGTTFRLRLPARVTIIPVFLVRAGEQPFAIPIAKIARAQWVRRSEARRDGSHRVWIDGQGMAVPFFDLARLLGIQESFEEGDNVIAFLFERGQGRALVAVDQFYEERDVYLKPAPRPLDRLRGLLGITIVRGEPVYVLDPGMMVWTHV